MNKVPLWYVFFEHLRYKMLTRARAPLVKGDRFRSFWMVCSNNGEKDEMVFLCAGQKKRTSVMYICVYLTPAR